jgi:hypothetical protein
MEEGFYKKNQCDVVKRSQAHWFSFSDHNILNHHWEDTLASPNMQQIRKIKK